MKSKKCSAPRERTKSRLVVVSRPITRRPMPREAIWTARCPRPPPAPTITMNWPGLALLRFRAE